MPAATGGCSKQGTQNGNKNDRIGNPTDWGNNSNEKSTDIDDSTIGAAASQLPIDVEDEISWVMHEFRRQGSPIHSIERGSNINRTINTKKRPFPGYFSDVRYHSTSSNAQKGQRSINGGIPPVSTHGPHIELSYLFDQVLVLKFHVYIRPLEYRDGGEDDCVSNKHSYTTFVAYTDDDAADRSASRLLAQERWRTLRESLHSICKTLNDNYSKSEKSSLFAIFSKLLLLLNQLQAKALDSKNTANSEKGTLLCPLNDRDKSRCLDRLLGKGSHSAWCPGGVDLAILLLRCAAMGKHAEVFAHPFPPTNTSITESIWNATECHKRFQRRRFQRATTNSKSSLAFHPSEYQLLGFLCSLPWMKRGRITVNRVKSENNEANNGARILFEVCLHLHDRDGVHNDASHSPRFARSCQKHGGITVYHGTHMENAWSILHNGFFNPSEVGRGGKEFVKNGAMLGSGVYLTNSHKVATHFATQNAPSRTVRSALKHDSLKNLLSMAFDGKNLFCEDEKVKDSGDGRSCFVNNLYNVSCFPVFEARIVRPPESDEPTSHHAGQKKRSSSIDNGPTATRRDGKYFVVPDAKDIQITKLHLTFELTRRKSGTVNFLLRQFLACLSTGIKGPSIALAVLVFFVAFAFGIERD